MYESILANVKANKGIILTSPIVDYEYLRYEPISKNYKILKESYT